MANKSYFEINKDYQDIYVSVIMRNSARRSLTSCFCALPMRLLRQKKLRCYFLALCFGLLVFLGLRNTLFFHVKNSIHPDYVGLRSGKMASQADGHSVTNVKPRIAFRNAGETDFQPVEVNSSYVYSAYLDDRQAQDVDPRALPVVRIFTALTKDTVDRAKRTWHCLFWYEAVDLPLVVPVTGITELNPEDIRNKIVSIMVLCSLPTNSTNDTPIAVSLVNDTRQVPQNHLTITDLRKRRKKFEVLSSTTSETWSQSKDISNFTICIPPLRGNYMTRVEIIEFIELNRLHGADKFVFFLMAPKEELVPCLRYYSRVGLVELYNWSLPFNVSDINYHGQILSQNECPYRTMYRTKFTINQDLDEFITPTRTETWKEMLDLIHKDDKHGERNRTASYSFRNLFFPFDNAKESFVVGEYKLKTMTKTICSDKSLPWKKRSKVMSRPERILRWHVHWILDSSLLRKGDVNGMVDERDGLLFHYRKMGRDFFGNGTNRRMQRFQKMLVASVSSRAKTPECRP